MSKKIYRGWREPQVGGSVQPKLLDGVLFSAVTVLVFYSDSSAVGALPLDASLKLRKHSPTGFEWGYAGSGPAQLALALLLNATGNPEIAQARYQDFKFDVVAQMPKTFWELTEQEIKLWLVSRAQIKEHLARKWDGDGDEEDCETDPV